MTKAVLLKYFAGLALVFFFSPSLVSAQQDDLRIGMDISPSFSWMSTNDNTINGDGSNLGLKIRLTGERYFRENYAISGGIGLSLGAGGTLAHETGGNFWPNSSLSDPAYNTGDKPLPDGVRLSYNLTFLEVNAGLKLRSNDMGGLRYFVDVPVFTLGILTQARGDIEGSGISSEKENIGKDVRNAVWSWGLGPGIEYQLEDGPTLVAGLYFLQTFTDVTRNKGYKAVEVGGTPAEPEYQRRTEDSKGRIGSLTIRLGVIF